MEDSSFWDELLKGGKVLIEGYKSYEEAQIKKSFAKKFIDILPVIIIGILIIVFVIVKK